MESRLEYGSYLVRSIDSLPDPFDAFRFVEVITRLWEGDIPLGCHVGSFDFKLRERLSEVSIVGVHGCDFKLLGF